MTTSFLGRIAQTLALLAHLGLRKIGGLIGLIIIAVWIWAAATGTSLGGSSFRSGGGVSMHSR